LRPSWAPDGTQIAFSGDTAEGFGIYVVNADGSEVRRILGPGPLYQPSWAATVVGE
jgi:Tol biopolymer transport system component